MQFTFLYLNQDLNECTEVKYNVIKCVAYKLYPIIARRTYNIIIYVMNIRHTNLYIKLLFFDDTNCLVNSTF